MSENRYQLSERAIADLLGIWNFVFDQSQSLETAEHVVQRILSSLDFLGGNRRAGHERPDLTPKKYRFWSVWSYLLVYDPEAEPLKVLRVFHGAQDVESELLDL